MKLSSLKKDDRIEVTWTDVMEDSSWQCEEDAAAIMPPICKTVGYFLNTAGGCLRLSGSVNRDGGQRSVQVMPLGLVLKVKKLG